MRTARSRRAGPSRGPRCAPPGRHTAGRTWSETKGLQCVRHYSHRAHLAELETNVSSKYLCLSALAALIESVEDAEQTSFVKARLCGIDLNKPGTKRDASGALVVPIEGPVIPEAMGLIAGCVYLTVMFIFIPFAFMREQVASQWGGAPVLSKYLSALLAICCMCFLGFADNVLDLRWRDKLWLPLTASLPLLSGASDALELLTTTFTGVTSSFTTAPRRSSTLTRIAGTRIEFDTFKTGHGVVVSPSAFFKEFMPSASPNRTNALAGSVAVSFPYFAEFSKKAELLSMLGNVGPIW